MQLSGGRIYPLLAGSDIGCGMGLCQLDLAVRKLRVDKAEGFPRSIGDDFAPDLIEIAWKIDI